MTLPGAPAPAPIPLAMRERIAAELSAIEVRHGVHILFAVESGSRAWGFPSPDSDFDVRFVYHHPAADYVKLAPPRDVIERPIDSVLDISGWDIRKAFNLLLKGNAVLSEWLASPIRYRWSDNFCAQAVELTKHSDFLQPSTYHYLHLATSHLDRLSDSGPVNLKTYFYALRAALALRHLRLHPGTPPPMDIAALMSGVDLDPDTIAAVLDLIRAKSAKTESGQGLRHPALDALANSETHQAQAQAWVKTTTRTKADTLSPLLDTLLLQILGL